MYLSLKFYVIFSLPSINYKYKLQVKAQVKAQVKVLFKMSRKWMEDKFIKLKLKLTDYY